MRRILIVLFVLLLATNLFGQSNVSVVKIDTERTLLNKTANVAPKLVQRHTYYLAEDGRQRHEITQVDTGKVTVEITLWAEHKQIWLDPQTKQADVLPAVTPAMPPTGRMGRMVVPQSQTDLGTKIVHGFTLHGKLFMMPYPQGAVRNEVWDYRGAVQSANFPPVIVESSWDDPTATEEERIVDVSNVQVRASIFEVPADFVQRNGIGDGAGPGLPAIASTARSLEQLATAEAKWVANKPKVYEFDFKLLACCVIRVTGPGSEPYTFHVENGAGSLTGIWATRPPQDTQGKDKYSTIDKVFTAIHEELAKWHDYRFEIDYDPALGYPQRVYFKRFQNAADDDYEIKIEGFKVLVR